MGLQQRKDRLKPTGDELPWRTFRKKGKVLWRRIVTRGGPGLPFALKTAKAGRRIEIACELVFHPESISPSCPPFLPQTQRSQRTAGQHVQSRSQTWRRTSGSTSPLSPPGIWCTPMPLRRHIPSYTGRSSVDDLRTPAKKMRMTQYSEHFALLVHRTT
jgi:hypothetical protein